MILAFTTVWWRWVLAVPVLAAGILFLRTVPPWGERKAQEWLDRRSGR